MTKNEKIAISISAVVGFVLFCILLTTICIAPLSFSFGETNCEINVEYDRLSSALGIDYVYLAQDFFNENVNIFPPNYANVMYRGRYGTYRDMNFEKPISKSQGYNIALMGFTSGSNNISIVFDCCKTNRIRSEFYDSEYGKYKYLLITQTAADSQGREVYKYEYHTYAYADNGQICDLKIMFIVCKEWNQESIEQCKGHCAELFKSMLDSLVGYSYYID